MTGCLRRREKAGVVADAESVIVALLCWWKGDCGLAGGLV